MPEKKLIVNPTVILREEFDDWGILYDSDTGNAFGVNPLGIIVWKHLTGFGNMNDLLAKIEESSCDVPTEAAQHIREFISMTVRLGLAAYEGDGE